MRVYILALQNRIYFAIGIGHQRALEVTKEFLDNLFLTTAIQIIADLGGQVDNDPHKIGRASCRERV